MSDIYISIDIETTGQIPGLHSMISLGAVAYRDGKETDWFKENLKEVYGRDEDTMIWWKQFPEAWEKTQVNALSPTVAVERFASWLGLFPVPLTLVGDPAVFDSAFLRHYMWVFAGKKRTEEVLGRFRMLDIRTLRAAVFNVDYSQANRELYPADWNDDGLTINHDRLDDAREQGNKLMKLLEAARRRFAVEISLTV